MLFAHFGVTGPAVMDVSHAVSGSAEPSSLVLRCDLLPEMKESELEARLATRRRRGGQTPGGLAHAALVAPPRGRNPLGPDRHAARPAGRRVLETRAPPAGADHQVARHPCERNDGLPQGRS